MNCVMSTLAFVILYKVYLFLYLTPDTKFSVLRVIFFCHVISVPCIHHITVSVMKISKNNKVKRKVRNDEKPALERGDKNKHQL